MDNKNYIYKKLSDGRYIKEIDNKVEHLATAQEDAKLATDIRSLLQGEQGESGTSGTSGQDGTSGKDGQKGDIGRTGLTGPRGRDGSSGSSGSSGSDGTSGINGQDGTSGINGRKGDKGDKGDRGFPGLQGPAGQKGQDGILGSDGTSGTSGINGSSGTSGINGIDASGTSGTSGISGTSGTSISSPFYTSTSQGATVSNTTSELVTYQQFIPANTFKTGDVIEILALAGWANTTYSRVLRVNGSTASGTLGGALSAPNTRLAQGASGASRVLGVQRHLWIYNETGAGEGTMNYPTGPNAPDDTTSGGGGQPTSFAIDWTKDYYIKFALQHSNILDTGRGASFYIKRVN